MSQGCGPRDKPSCRGDSRGQPLEPVSNQLPVGYNVRLLELNSLLSTANSKWDDLDWDKRTWCSSCSWSRARRGSRESPYSAGGRKISTIEHGARSGTRPHARRTRSRGPPCIGSGESHLCTVGCFIARYIERRVVAVILPDTVRVRWRRARGRSRDGRGSRRLGSRRRSTRRRGSGGGG